MKKFIKVTALALLGLILLWCILVWTGIFMSPEEFQQAEAKVAGRNGQTESSPPQALPGVIEVDDQGVPKPDGMSAEDWMRYLRVHATMIKANHPADLYLKFIDQHDQPVQGLKVTLQLTGGEGSIAKVLAGAPLQKSENIPMVSDANGMVILEGKRASSIRLDFLGLEDFKLGRGQGFFQYGSLLEAANSPSIFRPDKNKPLVYRVWRRGPPKPTYHWPSQEGTVSIKSPERYSTRVSLVLQPDYSVPIPETSVDLDWRGSPFARGESPTDWTLTITAVDGGVVKAPPSDEHGCLAPEEGYTKSITVSSKDPKVPGGSWFYFRNSSGRLHSAFQVGVNNSPGRLPHVALIEITTDPTGSRVLEYTPLKDLIVPYKK